MLHYFRCQDCLSSLTIPNDRLDAACACGGYLEYLGVVRQARIVNTERVSVCDARCTGAQGPECNCHCGGQNHGAGLTVTITHDHGAAVARPVNPAAIERGHAYQQACQAVRAALQTRYGDDDDRYRRGLYVADGKTWYALHQSYREYSHLRAGRTQARTAKLQALADDIFKAK